MTIYLAAFAAAERGGLGEDVVYTGEVGEPIGNLAVPAVVCEGTGILVGIGGDLVNEGDATGKRGELFVVGGAVVAGGAEFEVCAAVVLETLGAGDTIGNFLGFTVQLLLGAG